MKLSLSLLRDALPFDSRALNDADDASLVRYTFLLDETRLASGLVYIAKAQDIPGSLSFDEGAALACLGRPPESAVKSKLPLLVFPDSLNPIELAVELGAVFQRFHDLETALGEALQGTCELQDLVDIIAPYMGNKVTVVDSNHLILAHSYDDLSDLDIPDSDKRRDGSMVPVEIVGFFANNKRWVEAKTETEPFIYDEGIFDHRLLCINIISEGVFSWRVMLTETERAFEAYDSQLLVFFAGYVRKLYEKTLAAREYHETSTLRDSLTRLLAGGQVEAWQARHGLSARGFAQEAQLICICVRPEYWDDSTETISYYVERLSKLFPSTVAMEFRGDIVCLADTTQHGGSIDSYLAAVTPFARDNNFRIGVSERFDDFLQFKSHYQQAEIALTCGIEDNPSRWVHRFHEQAVRYILRQAGRETGIPALCSEKVLRLHSYDVTNQSSYVATMDCYLFNNLSIKKSAEDLQIHRATMVYRLKRIEEISGLTFKDAEKNLFYHLSGRMLMMMG